MKSPFCKAVPTRIHAIGFLITILASLSWVSNGHTQGDSQSTNGIVSSNAVQLQTFKQIEDRWGKATSEAVRKAALSGDATAQCYLGASLIDGKSATTNLVEGFNWYLKAGEQGLAHAQFQLGMIYAQGKGVPKNRSAAMAWMFKSADQGYTLGELNLGWFYANEEAKPGETISGNYPVAAEWYEKAASKGNAPAQYLLAELYHYGKLGNSQRTNCIPWYLKAAAQGHVKAQAQVGTLSRYYPNHPLLATNALTITFLRNAAEKGNLDAQFKLAQKYRLGEEVETNLTEAFRWMKLAAASDAENSRVINATYELARMYENGEGVARDMSEAAALYQSAAAGYLPDALFRVAVMHDQGTELPKDFGEAANYYFLAATRGWGTYTSNALDRLMQLYANGEGLSDDRSQIESHLNAFTNTRNARVQYFLGEIYRQGKLVKQDDGVAVLHYTLAATLGSAEAQNRIGQMWAAGLSGKIDPTEAAAWYQRAAGQGLAEAQYNLGRAFASGEGINIDLIEAWRWLKFAELQGHDNAGKELEALTKRMSREQLLSAQAKMTETKPAKRAPLPHPRLEPQEK